MSNGKEEMTDKKQNEVKLNDLPQEAEELKDGEAKQVGGGGGITGGVLGDRQGAVDSRLD